VGTGKSFTRCGKIFYPLQENHLPTAGKLSTHCWKIACPLLFYFQAAAENFLTAAEKFFTNTRNFSGAWRFCAFSKRGG
jgi:hypothetical protein